MKSKESCSSFSRVQGSPCLSSTQTHKPESHGTPAHKFKLHKIVQAQWKKPRMHQIKCGFCCCRVDGHVPL